MTIGCPHCRKSGPDCDCPASIRLVVPLQPIRDPEATVRAHASAAVHRLVERLQRDADRLVELAVERSTSLGARAYGDGAWSKPPDDLDRETDEELADALFYQGARFDVLREARA